MKKNIGKIDAVLRILIGIVLAYLFYENYVSNTLGIFLLTISGIVILTGFARWCPLYKVLNISTYKTNEH